jgi:sorting nexin-9/18/33
MPASSPSPSHFRTKSAATPPTVTLASASPPVGSASSSLRPLSDFDAGLNSSAAWTAQRAHDALSDDEGDSSDEGEHSKERGRPARALFAFDGKPEFRELSARAGDALSVLRDDAGDGWSLVRRGKEVGLLPKTYYTVHLSLPVAACHSY